MYFIISKYYQVRFIYRHGVTLKLSLVFMIVSILLTPLIYGSKSSETAGTTIITLQKIDISSSFVIQTNDEYIIAATTDQKCQLIKVMSNGTIIWQQKYLGAKNEKISGVIQTPDHGFLVAGSSAPNDIHYQCQIIKTNETGVEQWRKKYPSSGEERITAITPISDNRFALAGFSRANQSINYDYLIFVVDHEGNELWRKTYGDKHLVEKTTSILQTSDGGFALAGYKQSQPYGAYDFWLVKTDNQGTMQWNATYGGSGNEIAYSLLQTSDDGFVLAGYTTSYGAGAADIWVVKTDKNGTQQWNRTYGGKTDDIAYGLLQTPDGGFVLAGYTEILMYKQILLLKTDQNGYLLWKQNYSFPGKDATAHILLLDNNQSFLLGCSTQITPKKQELVLMRIPETTSQINRYPLAHAGTDATYPLNKQVTFQGTGYAPNGTIIRYRWDFNGDGLYDWESNTTATTIYTYHQPGLYHAYLEITDNNGLQNIDERIITITPQTTLSNEFTAASGFTISCIIILGMVFAVLVYLRYNKKNRSLVLQPLKLHPTIWWYRIMSIGILLIIIKLIVALVIQTPIINYDELAYGVNAYQISQGNLIFLGETPFMHPYPTGYSYLLAPAYSLSDNMDVVYQAMLLINSILSTLILIPVFLVMKRFVHKKIAFLTGLLIATLPTILSYNYLLMSENAFYFFFLCSCFLLLKTFTQDTKSKNFYLYALLLGCCLLILLFIRATAVAMILAAFCICCFKIPQRRKISSLTYGVIFLPILPAVLYFLFKNSNDTMGYNIHSYLDTISFMFTDTTHILRFLQIVLNEINYFILMSYIIFFGFTVFLYVQWKNISSEKKELLFPLTLYGFISGSILIFITTTHIHRSSFSIYSRYVSIVLPLLIMLGVIGIENYRQHQKRQPHLRFIVSIICTLLVFSIIFFFPREYYKAVNNLDLEWITYLESIQLGATTAFTTFLVILGLLTAAYNLILLYQLLKQKNLKIINKKTQKTTSIYLVFLLISILVFLPTAVHIVTQNQINMHEIKMNEPGRWFNTNDPYASVLFEDSITAQYNTGINKQYWTAIYAHLYFWMPKGSIELVNRSTLTTMITHQQINATYILSTYDLTIRYPLVHQITMNIPTNPTAVQWYIYKGSQLIKN